MHTTPEIVHLLVRYRDPAPGIDTIREHQKLLTVHGVVWFGKFGKAVGPATVRRMEEQVARAVPTFLYLTTRAAESRLVVHRGVVVQVRTSAPPTDDNALVPTYYGRIGHQAGIQFWVRLSQLEEIAEERLDSLVVASSRRPVRESLRSTAPFLLLAERVDSARS